MPTIEMNQDQMDYEANWPMPQIGVSDQITFYAQWNATNKPSLAWVTRVSFRSIECIVLAAGKFVQFVDVLHKDDPRLQRNQYMQQNGSWDVSSVEKRLRAIEARLAGDAVPLPADHVAEQVSVSVPEEVVTPRKGRSEESKAKSRQALDNYRAKRRQEALAKRTDREIAEFQETEAVGAGTE